MNAVSAPNAFQKLARSGNEGPCIRARTDAHRATVRCSGYHAAAEDSHWCAGVGRKGSVLVNIMAGSWLLELPKP